MMQPLLVYMCTSHLAIRSHCGKAQATSTHMAGFNFVLIRANAVVLSDQPVTTVTVC